MSDPTNEHRVSAANPPAVPLRPVLVIGETATTRGQREFLSRRHLPWNYCKGIMVRGFYAVGEISDVLQIGAPLARMRCMRAYFDGRSVTTSSGQDIGFTDYDGTWFDRWPCIKEPSLSHGKRLGRAEVRNTHHNSLTRS